MAANATGAIRLTVKLRTGVLQRHPDDHVTAQLQGLLDGYLFEATVTN